MVKRTIEPCKKALKAAGLAKNEIDEISYDVNLDAENFSGNLVFGELNVENFNAHFQINGKGLYKEDIDLEINRLSKRIDKLKKHILVSEKKLSNKNFVADAPENIITHEKEKMIQLKLEKELLKKNLKMIS